MKKELPAVDMAVVITIAIIFSAINAFVSMYLGLKTGFSNGIDILLIFISFIIVTALGVQARSKVLLYMCAIIAGSTGVAVSYIDGLGAIILSGKPFIIPDYAMMGILVLGGAIGLIMSYYFSGYFLQSDFPWPGSRAQASLINMLTAGKNDLSQRASGVRLGVSAAISAGIAGIRSVGTLPDIFGSVNLGVSVSPMMALIGVITGSVICVPFLRFFSSLYGIGSTTLPAPYSVMWLELADSTVAKVISPSLNPFLILAGVCIALGLYRYNISPIVVSIGLMLPVSTSAAIAAGGIIAYAVEKKGWLKGDNGITASGLMIGDIVVSILASLIPI
jgi:hypothetical protein